MLNNCKGYRDRCRVGDAQRALEEVSFARRRESFFEAMSDSFYVRESGKYCSVVYYYYVDEIVVQLRCRMI